MLIIKRGVQPSPLHGFRYLFSTLHSRRPWNWWWIWSATAIFLHGKVLILLVVCILLSVPSQIPAPRPLSHYKRRTRLGLLVSERFFPTYVCGPLEEVTTCSATNCVFLSSYQRVSAVSRTVRGFPNHFSLKVLLPVRSVHLHNLEREHRQTAAKGTALHCKLAAVASFWVWHCVARNSVRAHAFVQQSAAFFELGPNIYSLRFRTYKRHTGTGAPPFPYLSHDATGTHTHQHRADASCLRDVTAGPTVQGEHSTPDTNTITAHWQEHWSNKRGTSRRGGCTPPAASASAPAQSWPSQTSVLFAMGGARLAKRTHAAQASA